MGMFEKDILYGGERLDQWTDLDVPFVLYGVEVLDTPVPTSLGEATKTILDVASLDAPDNRIKVGTLASAIAEKAKDAEDSDFPAVVKLEKVPSNFEGEATVLSYIGPFDPSTGMTGEAANKKKSKAGDKADDKDVPF